MRQPFSTLVYAAVKEASEYLFLLFKRNKSPGMAEFWQGVSGGQEEGETIFQTAERELFEETGINKCIIEKISYKCEFPIMEQWKEKYYSNATVVT